MDQAITEKIKQYADIVRQTMQVKKIILYGSYASGCAHDKLFCKNKFHFFNLRGT